MSNDSPRHTIYVTKYCLTKGIQVYEGRMTVHGWLVYSDNLTGGHMAISLNDGYLNKEDAIDDAIKRREAKIKSHQRSIERLLDMTFPIPE